MREKAGLMKMVRINGCTIAEVLIKFLFTPQHKLSSSLLIIGKSNITVELYGHIMHVYEPAWS